MINPLYYTPIRFTLVNISWLSHGDFMQQTFQGETGARSQYWTLDLILLIRGEVKPSRGFYAHANPLFIFLDA